MATIRTIKLTARERQALEASRDHDEHPYVRERRSAILKIANARSTEPELELVALKRAT